MQYVVRGSDYLTKSGKSVGRKGGTKNRDFALGANEGRDYSKSIPALLGKGEHLSEPQPGKIVNIYVLFTEVAYSGGQYSASSMKSNVVRVKIGAR